MPRYYMLVMSTEMIWQVTSTGSDDTQRLGELLGSNLSGGEVIELVGDLGGGKTTFTQGLAKGLGSKDVVASPTFTLNKIYHGRGDLEIHHFDFYRLHEPGIMQAHVSESLGNPKVITVIEWSGIVQDLLPLERFSIKFEPTATDPDERQITIKYPSDFEGAMRTIETAWAESRL